MRTGGAWSVPGSAALMLASLAALFAACLLGSTPMEAERVLAALLGRGAAGDQLVVVHIRLPRALTAFTVGAALGASGAALQGLLRNPLAEPGVLGVSAMASLAATAVLYYRLRGRQRLGNAHGGNRRRPCGDGPDRFCSAAHRLGSDPDPDRGGPVEPSPARQ